MKIFDLLSPTDVMIDVRASNKRQLLQEFAAKAATSLGLHVDQIAPYLLKREELGSTGIGRGVAIPHARLPDLQRPYGMLAKLKQPIEFDAIDGQEVDLIFVLLLPAAAENRQLGALALVARALRPPENLVRLRSAKNASELYSAITDGRKSRHWRRARRTGAYGNSFRNRPCSKHALSARKFAATPRAGNARTAPRSPLAGTFCGRKDYFLATGRTAMARKYSKQASAKVERAMKKRKAGTLKSGRSGRKVTSRKQAIAIGLSEARAEGKKVPKKAARKTAGKKV